MLARIAFALFCLTTSVQVSAQLVDTAWVTTFDAPFGGPNSAGAIVVDGSGNVYVAGSIGVVPSPDLAVVKYASDGTLLWMRSYNGAGNATDEAHDIALDSQGNIVVTGNASGATTVFDVVTIKFYPNGDTAWVRTYDVAHGSDEGLSVTVDRNDNVIVTGFGTGVTTSTDYVTLKYSPSGSLMFHTIFGGPEPQPDKSMDVVTDTLGNVYITGNWNPNPEGGDFSTVKYGPGGNQVWISEVAGPNEFDLPVGLALSRNGTVVVAGTSGLIGAPTHNVDIFTVKLDAAGDTLWMRIYNSAAGVEDNATALQVDTAGNIYVVGYSFNSGDSESIVAIKYLPDGDTAWVRTYSSIDGGGNFDHATSAALDKEGNLYLTGSVGAYNFPSNANYVTMKYSPAGSLLWLKKYSSLSTGDDIANAITVDKEDNVLVTGELYNGFPGVTAMGTIKYVQYICGDANHSGSVNISDVVYLISYIFSAGPSPVPLKSGDANCDGTVNISDAVYLIGFIFAGGPAPCSACE